MAGIGFALGLAYLNLERFRYRKTIREFAKESVDRFRTQGIKQAGETMGGYGRVHRYATLRNNEPYNVDANSKPADLGRGLWCFVYGHLFENHNDRDFVGLFTFLAAFTIVLGVASSTFEDLASLNSTSA